MEKINFIRASRMCHDQNEFLTIASTPCDETCTQAGQDLNLQLIECIALRNQLKRTYGDPPDGAEFFILVNHHEFGTYYEVGIFYVPTQEDSETDSISEQYAFKCENIPEQWDLQAKQELRQAKHPLFSSPPFPLTKVA